MNEPGQFEIGQSRWEGGGIHHALELLYLKADDD